MIRHQVIVPLLGVAAVLLLWLWVFPLKDHPTDSHPFFPKLQTVQYKPLPDLSGERDIHRRKIRFFEYLLPVVRAENHRLADIRQRLVYIQEAGILGHDLDDDDQSWFESTLIEFRMANEDVKQPQFWPDLFVRVDQIPESLVLVQAANESAWGTSRFAQEGNNLFGQWCFSPGCGMVPEGRPEGEIYEVVRFESVAHSVAAYMRNLNTGHAYDGLRKIRADLRLEGQTVTAVHLAQGLIRYSQRGEDYISELLAMLRVNTPIIDEIRSPGPDKPEA